MLSRGGFLIRFIDIGLIILMGFIWISDISAFSHINMPSKSQKEATENKMEMVFLDVRVAKGGLFTVVNQDSKNVPCQQVDRKALESCLNTVDQTLRQNKQRPVVLIKPDKASAVQHTVDVLDICDRLGIPKNIYNRELRL